MAISSSVYEPVKQGIKEPQNNMEQENNSFKTDIFHRFLYQGKPKYSDPSHVRYRCSGLIATYNIYDHIPHSIAELSYGTARGVDGLLINVSLHPREKNLLRTYEPCS
ncbi:hypothetical protein ACROYT_G020317 [Oculina patagonica]